MIAFDSHRMKPSSSMVGTRPFGFSLRYSGVFTTPKLMPASMRSYGRPISSHSQVTFFRLDEFARPHIFSIRFLPIQMLMISRVWAFAFAHRLFHESRKEKRDGRKGDQYR